MDFSIEISVELIFALIKNHHGLVLKNIGCTFYFQNQQEVCKRNKVFACMQNSVSVRFECEVLY
jgi:hypothetical protein